MVSAPYRSRKVTLRSRDGTFQRTASGGLLSLDSGIIVGAEAVADRDSARLHRLRHFAQQLDLEQAVLERSAFCLDEVGEAEAALEVSRGNSLVQELLILPGSLAALGGQHVL